MRARFSDAQCGFKAGRTEVVRALLPAVEDQAWFFDTELLLAAQRGRLRIHEVPVDWVEDTDSRVDVVRTALDDLRGMARVARQQLPSLAPRRTLRSSSAPRTRPTSSPWTSRRPPCGSWGCRPGCSASAPGVCWCPRR
jgi:hypothetical protein